jgi:hypothetical protein
MNNFNIITSVPQLKQLCTKTKRILVESFQQGWHTLKRYVALDRGSLMGPHKVKYLIHYRGMRVYLHHFFTSALDGVCGHLIALAA